MAAKARRCLEKPKKTSNLGKNRHCLLYSFKSLYDSILMQCTVKMQSKVQSFNGDMWTIVELLRYDLQTVFNMILPSEPPLHSKLPSYIIHTFLSNQFPSFWIYVKVIARIKS